MEAMEPRSTTLRKACQNCTSAKRRCLVSLPRCKRCAQKGLECNYDLEPLANAAETPNLPQWQGSKTTNDVAVHCFLEKLSALDDKRSYPSRVPVRRDPAGVAYIVWALSLIPGFIAEDNPSAFIHPKLQLLRRQPHLASAIDASRRAGGVSPMYAPFLDLLRAVPSNGLFEDALGAIQALMLYMMSFLSDRREHELDDIESWFSLLSEWVEALELRARNMTLQGLSPWQGWLFGESTRRTILISHIFTCIFCSWKYELPILKLHMEALPFDGRVGLWQAQSPQAWTSAARVRKGEDVHTHLVSFHEFGSSHPKLSFDADGDMFLAMMLVAHNGRDKEVQN